MTEAKSCPFCGNRVGKVEPIDWQTVAYCCCCGAYGPPVPVSGGSGRSEEWVLFSREEAIKAWNRREP